MPSRARPGGQSPRAQKLTVERGGYLNLNPHPFRFKHPCSCVPMYRCTSVLVYRCTRLWVYLCTGISVYRCASVPVHQCIGIPVYLHSCTSASVCQCTVEVAPPKKRKNGSQKCWKNIYEVHLEVTRLERHTIFRRSISLDDVDCFDTLKSQTYQWHEFITLLFQGLRGPFRVVLMRASCQSRFLCDVIERKRTPILSCCHLAAFTVPHKAVSGPSCGPAESGICLKKTLSIGTFFLPLFQGLSKSF